MRDLFYFDNLITPGIIHIVYWLGIAVAVLAGLSSVWGGSIVKGLLVIVAGPIIVRVGCEVLIVLFRINENLAAFRHTKET